MSQCTATMTLPAGDLIKADLESRLNALKTAVNSVAQDQLYTADGTLFSLGNTKKIGDAVDPAGAWRDATDLQVLVTKNYLQDQVGVNIDEKIDASEGQYIQPPNASGVRNNVVSINYTPTTGSAAALHTFTINQEAIDQIPGYHGARSLSAAVGIGKASAANRLATMGDIPSLDNPGSIHINLGTFFGDGAQTSIVSATIPIQATAIDFNTFIGKVQVRAAGAVSVQTPTVSGTGGNLAAPCFIRLSGAYGFMVFTRNMIDCTPIDPLGGDDDGQDRFTLSAGGYTTIVSAGALTAYYGQIFGKMVSGGISGIRSIVFKLASDTGGAGDQGHLLKAYGSMT